MSEKIKVIAVVGPTASGKTSLGVSLAKRYNGEVISADSMQLYRQLNVASAKPSVEEMCGITHHLINVADISESFSAGKYCKLANTAADGIVSRKKLPIVVGGTGLYADSFLSNTRLPEKPSDAAQREKLAKRLENEGAQALLEELRSVDEQTASRLHVNNTVRILRALEVYYTTGKTLSEHNALSHSEPSRFDTLYIGIDFADRELLYSRINSRVDSMLENGILDEARFMYESQNVAGTVLAAIGCKEFFPYFAGDKTLDECTEELKRATRRYAKRQLTWFRANKRVNWIYHDTAGGSGGVLNGACSLADSFLEELS